MDTWPRALLRRYLPMGFAYLASSGTLVASGIAQLVSFAILARYFGIEQFALYVSFTAVTNIAVHLCGLGSVESLLRRVSRDRGMYPVMLGHTLIMFAATGGVLVALGMLVLPLVLPLSSDVAANLGLTFAMLLANVFVVQGTELAAQIFIAHSRFQAANAVIAGYAGARLATAATACLLFGVSSVADWALWHLGCHVAVAIGCALAVRRFGAPRFRLVREELPLGAMFSTSMVSKALRSNADLLMLTMVATPEIVGSFGLARRIYESSTLSVAALHRLMYPRLAVASTDGLHHAMEQVLKVLAVAVAIGVATALAVFIIAPWLPMLFGADYVSLVGFTQALGWLVVVLAIQQVATEALGASGHHGPRAAIINGGSILGVVLVAAATWWFSAAGTLAALYVTEAGMMVAGWLVLLALARRDRNRAAAQPAAN